jgi:hypothetical protein
MFIIHPVLWRECVCVKHMFIFHFLTGFHRKHIHKVESERERVCHKHNIFMNDWLFFTFTRTHTQITKWPIESSQGFE